jgi:hypothetical protein
MPIALASEGARFAQKYSQPGNLECPQLIVNLISFKRASTNIIISNFSKLIVIYSKIFFHFREDCRIYCEGEWEYKEQPDQIFYGDGKAFINTNDKPNLPLSGLVSYNCFAGLIGFVGHTGLVRHNGHVSFIGCHGHTGLTSSNLSAS